jgi:hypothetical protein
VVYLTADYAKFGIETQVAGKNDTAAPATDADAIPLRVIVVPEIPVMI